MARKRKPARVLIVEDQELTAQLFESFIENHENYVHAGTVKNAELAPMYCVKGDIDLILMDVYTELGASGLEAAATIKKDYPQIKIVIVTSMPEVSYIRRAKEAGVESFWYKEAGEHQLIDVMNRTMEGASIYPDRTPRIQLGLATSYDLTERELEVLREIVRGDTNQEIADKLYLSVATVKDYVRSLMLKTGFRTRTELAVRARELGLVIPE
ncbi:MAG: response regulator transcription factor [Lachnospiraceae bacterium]|nr:response regulator transcription factor [Lachnospiraceae bacterium]